jgi:hypothetical protein
MNTGLIMQKIDSNQAFIENLQGEYCYFKNKNLRQRRVSLAVDLSQAHTARHQKNNR